MSYIRIIRLIFMNWGMIIGMHSCVMWQGRGRLHFQIHNILRWLRLGCRFILIYINSGPVDEIFSQCIQQSPFIHYLPPGGIYDHGPVFHFGVGPGCTHLQWGVTALVDRWNVSFLNGYKYPANRLWTAWKFSWKRFTESSCNGSEWERNIWLDMDHKITCRYYQEINEKIVTGWKLCWVWGFKW